MNPQRTGGFRTTRLARAVYGVFGTLAIGVGVLVFVKPSAALPPDGLSPLTAHLVREEGAQAIFIGLMAFWCLFHFRSRLPVHIALLLFSGLFAGIHWSEYFQARRQLLSPVLNTIPLLALALITPFHRSESDPF